MNEAEKYQPYGKKWKDELMKLPKIQIIAMYRMVCLELMELKYNSTSANKESKIQQ